MRNRHGEYFLTAKCWKAAQKKIARSKETWNEQMQNE
jgi:hypothetical protein